MGVVKMKRREIAFDLVLASPATRARNDREGVAEEYPGFDREPRFEELIYSADSPTLIDLVHVFPDESRMRLSSTYPGLEDWFLQSTRDSERWEPGRRGVSDGGPAPTEFAPDRMAVDGPGSGDLVELILPRELELSSSIASARRLRSEIRRKMSTPRARRER